MLYWWYTCKVPSKLSPKMSIWPLQGTRSSPQHLLSELDRGDLRVSASVGAETLVATFTAITPHNQQVYTAKVTMVVSAKQLGVTLVDSNHCRVSAIGCFISEIAAPVSTPVTPTLTFNPTLAVGGIAQLTPYIRSKMTTDTNFRGCIGVRHCRELLIIYIYVYI